MELKAAGDCAHSKPLRVMLGGFGSKTVERSLGICKNFGGYPRLCGVFSLVTGEGTGGRSYQTAQL